jgi:hypothetical protein
MSDGKVLVRAKFGVVFGPGASGPLAARKAKFRGVFEVIKPLMVNGTQWFCEAWKAQALDILQGLVNMYINTNSQWSCQN